MIEKNASSVYYFLYRSKYPANLAVIKYPLFTKICATNSYYS